MGKNNNATKQLGLLVVDPFYDFDAYEFLESVTPSDWLDALAIWKNRPAWASSEELHLPCKEYTIPSKPYTCIVATLPEAIRRDFALDDLEFSFQLIGLILIINLSQKALWLENQTYLEYIQSAKFEQIGWFRTTSLNKLIIAVSDGHPLVSNDEMLALLGLDSKTLVVPYQTQNNLGSRIGFSQKFIQNILNQFVGDGHRFDQAV